MADALASRAAATVATAAVVTATVVAPAAGALAPGFRAALTACDDTCASLEARWRALVRWVGPARGRGGDNDAAASGEPPAAVAARVLFNATLAGSTDTRAQEEAMRAAVFEALLAEQ